MPAHATKRIYTPKSLEFWFDRLLDEWANSFKQSQLEQGRKFYREGQVRELEITEGEAIIHRRVDKRDEYALIEWEEGEEGRARFHVRSSTTNLEEARALAVAGFYEIEELIADEESAALPSGEARVGGSSAEAHAAGGAGAGRNTEPLSVAAAAVAARAREARADRRLLLVFKVKTEGLSFKAFWVDEAGRRQPALGAAAHAQTHGGAAIPVSSGERAKLIGLAAYARKAHLHYDQQSGVYLMASLVEIPRFLKTTLPAWEKLFAIELDERAGRLLEAPSTVAIEAVAGAATDRVSGRGAPRRGFGGGANAEVEGINLRWIFHAGERLLSPSEVRTLLKGGGQPTILPEYGIVAVEPKMLAAYKGTQALFSYAEEPSGVLAGAAGQGAAGRPRGGAAPKAETSLADREAAVLPPYLIFSLFNESGLRVSVTPEVEAWRQRVITPPEPAGDLPEILRPYQRRGVEWMAHLGEVGCHGLLADEMGLGKTLQVITLLSRRRGFSSLSVGESPVGDASLAEGGLAACGSASPGWDGERAIPLGGGLPSLVVCPASVVPVWEEEIARFAPQLRTAVLKAGHDFANDRRGGLVWIASYTQLRKHREQLAELEFGYAVLDEGQFIKNPDAKVTQTCWEIRARRRLVLTGTPLENRQLDLWSLFRFLLPGLLGTRAGFEAALAADRVGTTERLRAQLAPFILRRTKREVAKELPQKVEIELLCPLSDVQKAEYARTCSEGLERLGDDMAAALREKSFGFLALLTRLRQACCDPDLLPWREAPLSESGKLMLLVEKLSELIESGHKVVIFSQFVKLLDRVKAALDVHYPLLPRFELTGGTIDRQRPVQEFQTAVGAAAMLVSLKAAGTGITLHAADYVFLLDPWWNPAVEAQAIDRVHRIGQTNTVFVYRMVTAGTIEERIQDLKAEKRELFDKLLGAGGGADIDLAAHFASLRSLVQLGESAALSFAGSVAGANGAPDVPAASATPTSARPPARLDLAALAATMDAPSLFAPGGHSQGGGAAPRVAHGQAERGEGTAEAAQSPVPLPAAAVSAAPVSLPAQSEFDF